MRLIGLAALCVSFLPAMGCGGGRAVSQRDAVGRALSAPGSIPGLAVTVATDKSSYTAGEPIEITVSVTNTTASAKVLRYPTPSELHMWGYVVVKDGKVVTYEYWDGHGLAFPTVIGEMEYPPGSTRLFRYTLPLQQAPNATREYLQPGTYQVFARLPALAWEGAATYIFPEPVPASEPVTIEVQP
jgi:hypothetical protein